VDLEFELRVYICWAGALPLQPLRQPFFVLGILR
jgi:hypothetical protein